MDTCIHGALHINGAHFQHHVAGQHSYNTQLLRRSMFQEYVLVNIQVAMQVQ